MIEYSGRACMVAPSQRQIYFAGALVGVPEAETSTHLASASTSHRGAAASFLHQVQSVHGVSVTKEKHTCKCLGWSAGGRDEHAHCVCLRLALWSSRKLDRTFRLSVHGSSVAGALVWVPAAGTSTHVASTSASHRGAAASLIEHSGFACMASPSQKQTHLQVPR